MVKEYVKFTERNGFNNSFEIKDTYDINLGYITVLNYSKESKALMAMLFIYRDTFQYEKVFDEIIKTFTFKIFEKDIFKINIICNYDININPITRLGYTVEGILFDSYVKGNERQHQIIFGIDRDTYKNRDLKNIIKLKGDRVNLKILTSEDADKMLNYYIKNKEHLKAYEPNRSERFYTLEAQRNILSENYRDYLNGKSLNFGIFIEENLIGKVQISNIVEGIFKNAFVGYSIDSDMTRKGYMTEALKLILDYAFYDMELHRIEATTLTDNKSSQRVLLKCGFKKIGLSEKYLFINGKWRDHYLYYKVKE